MAVVALIPTGKLEHLALGPALARLFPDHDFVVRPPEVNLDGFTSLDVSAFLKEDAHPVADTLEELAKMLVNAIFPGRKGEHVDFAYVIEDLELVNRGQPDLVIRLFRDAVANCLELTWPGNAQRRDAVRDKCSFHLFSPMTEAYFFGEPAALQRAGASAPPSAAVHPDLEQFHTTDGAYLAAPEHDRLTSPRLREHHPKSYLHYLCDSTLSDKKRKYRETKNGVAALSTLAWNQVMQNQPHCPFLHAFMDDLSEALSGPLLFIDPEHADHRVRYPKGTGGVLRNI